MEALALALALALAQADQFLLVVGKPSEWVALNLITYRPLIQKITKQEHLRTNEVPQVNLFMNPQELPYIWSCVFFKEQFLLFSSSSTAQLRDTVPCTEIPNCCGLLVLYLALGELRCTADAQLEGVVYHFLATRARPASQNNAATASQATRLISQNFTHSSRDWIRSNSQQSWSEIHPYIDRNCVEMPFESQSLFEGWGIVKVLRRVTGRDIITPQ